MSDYTPVNDFSAKDILTPGDPEKVILGSDMDAELAALQVAINSKYDSDDIALQAAAEAGSANTGVMTPLRTSQAVAAYLTAIDLMPRNGETVCTLGTMSSLTEATVAHKRVNDVITLYINSEATGPSSANDLFLIGLPSDARPIVLRTVVCLLVNNGIPVLGIAYVDTDGTITFALGSGSYSGTKGLPYNWNITFPAG